MSIPQYHSETKLLVQGITGSFGARHTQFSLAYGTQVVAGVTPGKGGQKFESKGVRSSTPSRRRGRNRRDRVGDFSFRRRSRAMRSSKASTPDSISWCASPKASRSTDMVKVKRAMQGEKTRSSVELPGVVTPGEGKDSHGGCRIGIAPDTFKKRATSASCRAVDA